MGLAPNTFEYLKPTEPQVEKMTRARLAAAIFAAELELALPDGPDKTYIMRELRSLAMWCNVTITRQADGSPRT